MHIDNTWIRCYKILINLKWFMSYRFLNGISLRGEHLQRES